MINSVAQQELFGINCAVSTIQTIKQGFVAAGVGGMICIYEFTSPDWSSFRCMHRIPLPLVEMSVTSIASTSSDGILLVEVDTNQIFKIGVSSADLAKVLFNLHYMKFI